MKTNEFLELLGDTVSDTDIIEEPIERLNTLPSNDTMTDHEKVYELAVIMEEIGDLEYDEGRKLGFKVMINLYNDMLKPYLNTPDQDRAVKAFERLMMDHARVNGVKL
jgi:hypothetical protein